MNERDRTEEDIKSEVLTMFVLSDTTGTRIKFMVVPAPYGEYIDTFGTEVTVKWAMWWYLNIVDFISCMESCTLLDNMAVLVTGWKREDGNQFPEVSSEFISGEFKEFLMRRILSVEGTI